MTNGAIRQLRHGQVFLNGWLMIPDALAAEVMTLGGFDSLTIDLQHGLHDYRSAVTTLQALHGRAVTPLVRVPWNEPGIIGQMLDAGALGIICPMVNSAHDATALVQACLYASQGMRSYGPIRAGFYGGFSTYHTTANDTLLILPQIETAEAVENIEAILDVPGISGVYVGPGDLGLSLGMPPVMDREEPRILAIYERIVAATSRRGLIAGIHNASAPYAARMERMGFQFLTVATDVNLIGTGAGQAVHTVRALREDNRGAGAATPT